jgi:hypothetical protein
MASDVLNEHREELDKVSLLLMEHESIDKVEFEAVVAGEDPTEVFRARDEARDRKAAESKRVQRQRRPREQDALEPEGRVATGGVTPMASPSED